jgi:asparagine synthase (glutamine-hydrolysing)|tara:strand:- start:121 stop:504 length:384 start_codon:yes stop_codon:yes gene_type:complete
MLKVDRTSMANSLEIRSPFVDHNLIEYILSRKEIDLLKYTNKKILKDELTADFGPQFTGRKKMGFVFNLENWIYSNSEEVLSTISDSSLSKLIDVSQITLLFRFKSRINAQRIWKLYFLSIYLEDIT